MLESMLTELELVVASTGVIGRGSSDDGGEHRGAIWTSPLVNVAWNSQDGWDESEQSSGRDHCRKNVVYGAHEAERTSCKLGESRLVELQGALQGGGYIALVEVEISVGRPCGLLYILSSVDAKRACSRQRIARAFRFPGIEASKMLMFICRRRDLPHNRI